mmetsp:Transcript_482/g.902  ORF Transcript_482/g.902 Transcript_482/m.902 type:complete len:225 (-) Transcript_482:62-736(-)
MDNLCCDATFCRMVAGIEEGFTNETKGTELFVSGMTVDRCSSAAEDIHISWFQNGITQFFLGHRCRGRSSFRQDLRIIFGLLLLAAFFLLASDWFRLWNSADILPRSIGGFDRRCGHLLFFLSLGFFLVISRSLGIKRSSTYCCCHRMIRNIDSSRVIRLLLLTILLLFGQFGGGGAVLVINGGGGGSSGFFRHVHANFKWDRWITVFFYLTVDSKDSLFLPFF